MLAPVGQNHLNFGMRQCDVIWSLYLFEQMASFGLHYSQSLELETYK